MGEEWTPSVDLSEKEGKYLLKAELPGMTKDDISVTYEDGVVTITGKKESKKEEEGADYYVRESRYGSFTRSFRLPTGIDESKVDAQFKDGVLTVAMPKKEGEKSRKIDIK
ncbi:Hsp20/alpha crystallin family protein [Desulfatiglans anilini]|uniref:Hsp20/alpha crystallin family protein n=1 Tax=Desulfatiglans anilini TaxID=90728 RepID=UPI001378F44C|nr:Hsp20/alpha crystallin family protein [Desulfatiglans anilini]